MDNNNNNNNNNSNKDKDKDSVIITERMFNLISLDAWRIIFSFVDLTRENMMVLYYSFFFFFFFFFLFFCKILSQVGSFKKLLSHGSVLSNVRFRHCIRVAVALCFHFFFFLFLFSGSIH